MKKTLIGILITGLFIGLTACGNKETPKPTSQSDSSKIQEKTQTQTSMDSKRVESIQLLANYEAWLSQYSAVLSKYTIEINNLGAEMSNEMHKAYDPNAIGEDGVPGGALPDISATTEKFTAIQNEFLSQYTSMLNESSTWQSETDAMKRSLTGDDLANFNERLSSIEQEHLQLTTDMKNALNQGF